MVLHVQTLLGNSSPSCIHEATALISTILMEERLGAISIDCLIRWRKGKALNTGSMVIIEIAM